MSKKQGQSGIVSGMKPGPQFPKSGPNQLQYQSMSMQGGQQFGGQGAMQGMGNPMQGGMGPRNMGNTGPQPGMGQPVAPMMNQQCAGGFPMGGQPGGPGGMQGGQGFPQGGMPKIMKPGEMMKLGGMMKPGEMMKLGGMMKPGEMQGGHLQTGQPGMMKPGVPQQMQGGFPAGQPGMMKPGQQSIDFQKKTYRRCAYCGLMKPDSWFYPDLKCNDHEEALCYCCIVTNRCRRCCPVCYRDYSRNEMEMIQVLMSAIFKQLQ